MNTKDGLMRQFFPYGKWTCEDGREVLFNRDYKPLFERKGGVVRLADKDEWVPFKKQEFFYTDTTSPWRRASSVEKCLAVLKEWHIL